MSPLSQDTLRDPELTNFETTGIEVIKSVATLVLITNTTTVTTKFWKHMSVDFI